MAKYSGGMAQLCICSAKKKSVNFNIPGLWGHFPKQFLVRNSKMWVSWGSDWSAKQEHSWTSGGIRFSESVKYFWSWYRHLILVSNPMFFGMGNHGESCGTIFVSLRLIWRPRSGWRGCRRPRTSSRSEIINLNLTLDFGVKPHVFWHGEPWGIM